MSINMKSFVTPGPAEIGSSGAFNDLVTSLKENMTNHQLDKSQESQDKVRTDWGSFGSKESRVVACLMAIGKRHLNNDLAATDLTQLYTEVNAVTKHELRENEAAAMRLWARWLLCMKTGEVHEE